MNSQNVPTELAAPLQRFKPTLPLAVAYSGGADSTALLLAAHRLWPGQVYAFHVHHGLQAAADGFSEHGSQRCAALGIPFYAARVHAKPSAGQSPEDAARRSRYVALIALAGDAVVERGIASILLGQHADDQVETLMIALSRGAGLPGLAAMPAYWQEAGLNWYRPFLELPGQMLRDWLVAEGIDWMEDPSNKQMVYTRNRIRHQLLPVIAEVFPQFRATFMRSASHAAQAHELLVEIAVVDMKLVGHPPAITKLQTLSAPRMANLLRYWLNKYHGASASSVQLAELQKQIAACATRGHGIALKIGSGTVKRNGIYLQYLA